MTEPKKPRAVTEFRVTYFGLSELESDALLDLYADHAYKFAERHQHETPLIGSRSWPTEEAWETDAPLHPQNGVCVAAGEPGTDSADSGACGGGCEAAGALRRDVWALVKRAEKAEAKVARVREIVPTLRKIWDGEEVQGCVVDVVEELVGRALDGGANENEGD